jgi:hypothetical protein
MPVTWRNWRARARRTSSRIGNALERMDVAIWDDAAARGAGPADGMSGCAVIPVDACQKLVDFLGLHRPHHPRQFLAVAQQHPASANSFILKERPSGRPRPSSILTWRTSGCRASTVSSRGCAAMQCPHHGAPNSIMLTPRARIDFARSGSTVA